MRFRIIKVTYGDGNVQFKIKYKHLFFWFTRTNFFDETEYFDSFESAFEKVKELALREMSSTEIDVEIVYEGDGKQ